MYENLLMTVEESQNRGCLLRSKRKDSGIIKVFIGDFS